MPTAQPHFLSVTEFHGISLCQKGANFLPLGVNHEGYILNLLEWTRLERSNVKNTPQNMRGNSGADDVSHQAMGQTCQSLLLKLKHANVHDVSLGINQ